MNIDKTYKTFDLNLTTALVSAGHHLIDLDKTNPRRIRFIFKSSPKLHNDIEKYWADSLSLNIRSVFDTGKMIKSRIYEEKQD